MTNTTAKTSGVMPSLPQILIEEGVRAALKEDLGRAGDLTTDATIGPDLSAKVSLVSREAGRLCGVDFARSSFALAGAGLAFEVFKRMVMFWHRVMKSPGSAAMRAPSCHQNVWH